MSRPDACGPRFARLPLLPLASFGLLAAACFSEPPARNFRDDTATATDGGPVDTAGDSGDVHTTVIPPHNGTGGDDGDQGSASAAGDSADPGPASGTSGHSSAGPDGNSASAGSADTGESDTSQQTGDSGTMQPDDCATLYIPSSFESFLPGWYGARGHWLGDADGDDAFLLTFHSNATGSFALGSGANANNATCQQCVIFNRDRAESAELPTSSYFIPDRGTITLAAGSSPAGVNLRAEFTGVRLIEVTLDSDRVSTPVPGGECIRLIDTSVSAQGVNGWTCFQALYGGGDMCDCGCGLHDPDCGTSTSSAVCEQCSLYGSCANSCDDISDTNNAGCF